MYMLVLQGGKKTSTNIVIRLWWTSVSFTVNLFVGRVVRWQNTWLITWEASKHSEDEADEPLFWMASRLKRTFSCKCLWYMSVPSIGSSASSCAWGDQTEGTIISKSVPCSSKAKWNQEKVSLGFFNSLVQSTLHKQREAFRVHIWIKKCPQEFTLL